MSDFIYDTVDDAEKRAELIAGTECYTHLVVTKKQLEGLLAGKFIANAFDKDGFVIGLQESFDRDYENKLKSIKENTEGY